MRGIDEIFSNSEEMSMEEKLDAITKLSEMRARGAVIEVMGVAIEISPVGVDAHANVNSTLAKRFGLEKTFQDFAKEITPILEKYSKIVSEKYREDFKSFVRGGMTPGRMPDFLIELLKRMIE